MFDAVVQVNLSKIERVLPVRLFQQPSHDIWDHTAEGGSEVEGRPNGVIHLNERNILPVSRQNSWTMRRIHQSFVQRWSRF